MQHTLVLDSGYRPHRVVSWQRAAQLLHDGRAEVVELYEDVLRAIHKDVASTLSLRESMWQWFEHGSGADPDMYIVKMPAVVRLYGTLGRKKVVKFSRINVLTRDNFSCCYCGSKKLVKELNYDHVLPRSMGGKTTWENIVSSCYECNAKKGSRTPEQAGMKLLRAPVKPKSLPIAALRLDGLKSIPECWRSWLYWNVELEP